jgi:hypothetical protein
VGGKVGAAGEVSRSGASGGSNTALDRIIRRKVKDGKGKVSTEEVVRSMAISAPTDVKQTLHVKFDKKNIRLSGLPSDWDLGRGEQFGVSLQSCPRLEVEGYAARIPGVLVLLRSSLLKMDGLALEGIFRLAPDKEECKRVKAKINSQQGFEAMTGCRDANVPATLIKQWFRELQPRMVLNCLDREQLMLYEQLAAQDLDKVGPKVLALPEPEQSALLWLLDLLAEVAQLRDVNKMSPKNLAICLAPNLYDAAQAPPMEALALSQKVASLIENVLLWRIRENNATHHATELLKIEAKLQQEAAARHAKAQAAAAQTVLFEQQRQQQQQQQGHADELPSHDYEDDAHELAQAPGQHLCDSAGGGGGDGDDQQDAGQAGIGAYAEQAPPALYK